MDTITDLQRNVLTSKSGVADQFFPNQAMGGIETVWCRWYTTCATATIVAGPSNHLKFCFTCELARTERGLWGVTLNPAFENNDIHGRRFH